MMKPQTRKKPFLGLIALLCAGGLLTTAHHHTAHATGTVQLTVSSNPAGAGTLTSTDGKLNCGSTCTATYNQGDTVTVNFTPAAGYRLFAWDAQGCPSTSLACTFNVSTIAINGGTTASLSADTVYSTYNVTATKVGSGSGTVSGTGAYNYANAQSATLVATPSANSVFVGWLTSGDICYALPGKFSAGGINTSPNCSANFDVGVPQNPNAVAQFDLKPGATSSTPSSPTKSSAAPVATPAVVAPPSAPTPSIKLGGGATIKPTDIPTVKAHQPLLLSGTTVPNGVVNIYVFSVPQEHSVTADKNGNWSYQVATAGLPAGSHHIEAEVTDPATGKTSARAQVLAFTLAKAAVVSAATPTPPAHHTFWAAAGTAVASLLVLAALATGYLWWFQPARFKSLLCKLGLKQTASTVA